ncbi:sigma-70 family RNA polymerase sigma factor [Bremerella alba]|uniref:ECF RNA polymerase sigma factor SigF n=1 Tax=Bremerella alba TaxID=980252 RepID=A0A7V9A7F7_9BACT|nr:sigma-70 family RNA polymerase sigma factor [Bremerella alba]MBA2114981.1 ECF RNA polymerase sigma factor SigF [Bremerella alba]
MLMSETSRNARFVREFACHEEAIRAYVRRLVPSRADCDDILQEVAIVLWEKFDEFHEEGNFRSWAFGFARYKVLSWLRDNGRRRLVLDSDVVAMIADESIEEDSHLEAQRLALRSCFGKLPSEQRSLVANAYSPDVKIQEIAATSGRSTAGFYQWLYRIRQMLLECVQRQLASEANP